jgi:preprotein translocase subunit YajC
MTKITLYLSITFYSIASFANEAAPKPDLLGSFMPLILIFAIFYFFMIRPQQKKMKEREEIVDSLKIGDIVITDSGIYGAVSKINENEGLVLLEVSKGNIIKIRKQNIIELSESKAKAKVKNSPKIIKEAKKNPESKKNIKK